MAPPTRIVTASNAAPIATTESTADLASPRPALMDRLHFDRADSAQAQRTLGNQMAQQLARQRRLTGDAPRDGSARGVDPSKPELPPPLQVDDVDTTLAQVQSLKPAKVGPVAPSPGRTQPAPAPAPSMGVPSVKPPPPGPASSMGDLQSQVTRAANSIPRPAAEGYSAAQQAIRSQGFRLASAHPSASAATQSSGGGHPARPEHPERPYEPDPVPKESRALRAAADKKLTGIPNPGPLESTPLHHIPRLGTHALSGVELEILIASPPDLVKTLLANEDARRLKERAEKRAKEAAGEKDPKRKAAILEGKARDDEQLTFQEMRDHLLEPPSPDKLQEQIEKKKNDPHVKADVPMYPDPEPPGPIVFEQANKDQLGKVLAGLMAEPEATAEDILRQIRPNVVSKVRLGAALAEAFPTIGESQKGKVAAAFKSKIADLQKGAGITDAQLAKAIEDRKAELKALRLAANQSLNQAQLDAQREQREKTKEQLAVSEAKKAAAANKAAAVKKAAPKAKFPMDADARRTRLLGYVTQDVADMVVKYKQKGEVRGRTVEQMVRDLNNAYTFAEQQDEYQISTTAKDPKSVATGAALEASRDWLTKRTKAVEQKKKDQNKADAAEVVRYQDEVRRAGEAKREAIRVWAAKLTGKKRTVEQKSADALIDAAEQFKAEAAAQGTLDKQRLAQGVNHDFAVVDRLAEEIKQGRDRETIIASLHLNAIQIAILDAYLKPPERGDDRALSGVMAGVKMQLQMELLPQIGPEIEKEILADHSDADPMGLNFRGLSQIGAVQSPGFDAAKRSTQAYDALDKINTDEDAVYESLDSLTKIQAQAIRLTYIHLYGHTIEKDLEGGYVYGMSGSELKRAQLLLAADQKGADALGYRIALKGNEGAWYHVDIGSGDPEALDKINHGKTLEERRDAEDTYNEDHDPELQKELVGAQGDEGKRREILEKYRASGKSQLRDDANDSLSTARQKERFAYSMAGDDDSADALELRDHLPTPADVRIAESARSITAPVDPVRLVVADRKKVEAIYDRIRREATARADREHWTSQQLEAEIARRTQKIEGIFNAKFANDYETPGKSPLRAAFDLGFRYHDDEKNIANGLADNDLEKVDAAKIHVEHRGVYASDDVENSILSSQYQRALAERQRDEMPLRRLIMARDLADLEQKTRADARARAVAALRKSGLSEKDAEQSEQAEIAAKYAWDGAQQWAARERMQRQIDRTLEDGAREQAKGNMNGLREAYKRDYDGNLDEVVRSDTSGYSGDKAMALLAQDGRLTLGQTMFYAIRGLGTDEEALKTLKGHTKAEIDEARRDFRKLALQDLATPRGILNQVWSDPDSDPTDMDSEIMDDISGRTAFDIGQMLKGEPETIDEKRERLLEAIAWENKAGPLGQALGSTQQNALWQDLQALDETIQKLKDPNLSAEQREVYIGFFDQGVETVNAGIQAHRAVLDSWTDRITTVVGIVVGLAVTAITFGAAGPVLAAVIGSIMATATNMALKASIQGAAYGWEDIATDIAVGVVDAIAAALTAGMGNRLLGEAVEATVPKLSKLAIGRFVQRSLGAGGRLAIINPAESVLARMIPTSAALKELVERGGIAKMLATVIAETGESLVQATPAALASSILDENNYKEGNPLANILSGTVKQVGTGAVMGLGIKAGMHIGKPMFEFAGAMFGAMRAPEAPQLHNFELARQEFPGITYNEFTKLRAAAVAEMNLRERVAAEHPTADEHGRSATEQRGAHESAGGAKSTERLRLPDEHIPGEEVGAERPSQADAPGPHDTSVIKGDDLTRPREMTQADAHELVPTSLRDKLEITVDRDIPAGEVRVERVMRLGIVVEVKLVVGPHVRPIDVMLHASRIHAMQRYLGVTGRLVRLIERLRSKIVRDGMPEFGTKAWESWHELHKLPAIIDQRLEMLRTGQLDPHAEAMIHADLERLSRHVDEHLATVESMDKSPGVGYIAMPGDAATTGQKLTLAESQNPDLKRYKAENSTLADLPKYRNAEFVSVERPWIEMKPEGPRTYRIIEIRDPNTKVVLERRMEVQSLDLKGKPKDRWRARGLQGNRLGEVGEEGFRIQFEAEKAAGGRKNEFLLPPELVQLAGGQGFDGVILKFDDRGRATLVLVEAKNYRERYLPLKDITAINDNLQVNLDHIESLLNNPALHKDLGITAKQAMRAVEAIENSKLEFELRLGETTHLGDVDSARSSVLRELRDEIAAQLPPGANLPQSNVRALPIEGRHLQVADRLVEARERLGFDSTEEVRKLATAEGHRLTAERIQHVEAALLAQAEAPEVVGPLTAKKEPGTFVDSKRNPFKVVTVESARTAIAAEKSAAAISQSLRSAATRPGRPMRVIVDITNLTRGEAIMLGHKLQTQSRGRPKFSLDRLVVVDLKRGTAAKFASLLK